VEQPAGTFALTAEGALLRSDAPGSLRHFSTLMVGEAYQVWELAGHSLRTGEAAFARRFGKPMFEWLADHPGKAAGFDAAQAGWWSFACFRCWSATGAGSPRWSTWAGATAACWRGCWRITPISRHPAGPAPRG
jgi:hypothetical protein